MTSELKWTVRSKSLMCISRYAQVISNWHNSSASEIPWKPSTFPTSLLVLLRDAFLTLICLLFHLVSMDKSFCNFLIYLQVSPFTEMSKCYGRYQPAEGQMSLRYIHSSNSMKTNQTSHSSHAKTSILPSVTIIKFSIQSDSKTFILEHNLHVYFFEKMLLNMWT